MTNDEVGRNDQIRMTKSATSQLKAFRHSGFGFLSSFVIRHSSFDDLCKPGSWSECLRKNEKGALPEPTHPRPLPGGEPAFVRGRTVPLPGGVRGGFIVPMRAKMASRLPMLGSNARQEFAFPCVMRGSRLCLFQKIILSSQA